MRDGALPDPGVASEHREPTLGAGVGGGGCGVQAGDVAPTYIKR